MWRTCKNGASLCDWTSVNETYEAWNRAFIAEYFPEGNVGRLAWLPVDDDEVRALAERYELAEPSAAIDEFVRVVNTWLATRGGSFTRFTSGISGWRRVRDTPPYVAGLAFSVLAASRMAGDTTAKIASSNYYAQLNRMIGRRDTDGIPRGFDQLGEAWRDFTTWLDTDCEGRRGLSTFRTNTHVGKHVGYPMSQSLLRACDRRRLPDFFRSAGLEPDSEVSENRVFTLLRAWAALPGCGLTQRARAAIANAADIDLHEIAETVVRELRTWDGELRDSRGRRRATIHLLVIPRRRGTSIQFLARQPDGFLAGAWTTRNAQAEIFLRPHPAADGWFAPLDLPVGREVLREGFTLTRGDLALSFEAAEAIPCRQAAPEIGGYISQPQATMFEPHLALVRRDLLSELKDYLGRHADSRPEARPSPPGFPAEWSFTTDFRFVSRPSSVPPAFGRLAPRVVATTSISGGLRLAPNTYLTGGEPDVNVATEEGSALVPELDGVAHPIKGGALTLRLSEMKLAPGEHELVADVTRRFSTVENLGDVEPPGAGALGFKFARHNHYRPQSTMAVEIIAGPPAGWIHLAGALAQADPADLPLPDRPPVLVRSGARRYVLLDERGSLHRLWSPKAPSWLQRLGLGETFQFVDLTPDFDPVWLLREMSSGAMQVVALQEQPVAPAVEGQAPDLWAKSVSRWSEASVPDAVRSRWLEYVAVAESAAP